jgi:hypothetical protein
MIRVLVVTQGLATVVRRRRRRCRTMSANGSMRMSPPASGITLMNEFDLFDDVVDLGCLTVHERIRIFCYLIPLLFTDI